MVNTLAVMATDLATFAIRKLTAERDALRVSNEELRARVASLESLLGAKLRAAPNTEGSKP